MGLHHTVRYGQTESGPVVFGGEEWGEDFLSQVIFNAWSGVGDADADELVVFFVACVEQLM